jgi:hypothetical protein
VRVPRNEPLDPADTVSDHQLRIDPVDFLGDQTVLLAIRLHRIESGLVMRDALASDA